LFFSVIADGIVYFANADAPRIGIANIIILLIGDVYFHNTKIKRQKSITMGHQP